MGDNLSISDLKKMLRFENVEKIKSNDEFLIAFCQKVIKMLNEFEKEYSDALKSFHV